MAAWNNKADSLVIEKFMPFSDSLRKMTNSTTKPGQTFNSYNICDIILKKDGGIIIAIEDFTLNLRSDPWYFDQTKIYSSEPYLFSSFVGHGTNYYNNIIILNFDNKADLVWSNIITKSKHKDSRSSYSIMRVGNDLHFLYNEYYRHNEIMTEQILGVDGEISKKNPLRHLDLDYQLMSRCGKQISSNEIVYQCIYRNYICLAKIKY